ncbi:abortive infection family protein [Paraclostridium sordellii]|uniref:abortive infection family protein n=1 Tax=Paraclostridium sordellii TaxID=1505 RepID=UPI0022E0FD38|nr:abortive infection family protein [Paeniclostridium sordellii]
MSDLQSVEQMQFEELFDMESGVVLDFSNKKFRTFVYEYVELDIYDDKYSIQGDSKAKRLRSFIKLEDNYTIAKLLDKLLEVWVEKQLRRNDVDDIEEIEDRAKLRTYKKCKIAIDRLNENSVDVEVLESKEEDFILLVSQIKISIDNGQADGALDRLHTYMMKYMRKLCIKHNIEFTSDEPLHSLFGKYIKVIEKNNIIETEMTIRILKSNISILEKFNFVRNNQTLAHDNDVLNYNESVFVFNSIIPVKAFIDAIEGNVNKM